MFCISYLARDAGRGEALVLAVLIKEPAHHAAACTDLWTRDVNIGTHHSSCVLQPQHQLRFAYARQPFGRCYIWTHTDLYPLMAGKQHLFEQRIVFVCTQNTWLDKIFRSLTV